MALWPSSRTPFLWSRWPLCSTTSMCWLRPKTLLRSRMCMLFMSVWRNSIPILLDNILTVHSIMTRGLMEDSGILHPSCGRGRQWESCPVDWAKTSEVHMLIRNCVFHYELELIHHFADGNERIGCVWHTLLLSKWNLSSMTASERVLRCHQCRQWRESPRCSLSSCSQLSKYRS